MPKSQRNSEVIGVRLNPITKQDVAKKAAILGVATSSFMRSLILVGLDQVERDPAVLLKRSEDVDLSSN